MFEFLKKIFSSIIGFRSIKKINMIIASCYYIFFLIVSLTMGKGFVFGVIFTFTIPVLTFAVVDMFRYKTLRPLLNISICFLLITIFAFTVPTQQTGLSSRNIIKQTATEKNDDTEKLKSNQYEKVLTERKNDEISNDINNIKCKNENKENTIEPTPNIKNEDETIEQTTTEKNDDTEKNENVLRIPTDNKIDNNGFIYNLNKTFNIGMTEITVKRFIIRTSWGKYITTMEYEINNNDDIPINWKFSNTNKGNMIGTIVTNSREKIWMGKASNYTDEYIDQHIESGTLQAKSKFNASVNFAFDIKYEDPKLKENEIMNFTIYYSQNNIDSEFSIILNEK